MPTSIKAKIFVLQIQTHIKASVVGIGSWFRVCKQYNKFYSLLLTARSFQLWLDMQPSPPASSQGFVALWLLSCQPWSYNSSEHLGLTWVSVESKRKYFLHSKGFLYFLSTPSYALRSAGLCPQSLTAHKLIAPSMCAASDACRVYTESGANGQKKIEDF